MADSQKKRATLASAWTIAGYGISQVLRLGANIVVAAVLFEEAFALMAIVNAVIQGLAMFSDLGFAPSVVHSARGNDRRFLGTVWTMQIARGIALFLIAIALTWPIASMYARTDAIASELYILLPLAACATLIAGFNSVRILTAGRNMALGRLTILELISQIAGLIVMVWLAVQFKSLYSLALGGVVSAIIYCAGSHALLHGPRDTLAWDRNAALEVFRFGKWVFASTALSFLALQLDRLILPAMFSLAEAGVYSIAASVAMLVPSVMARLQLSVAFPLYSRAREIDDATFSSQLARITRASSLLAGSIIAIVIACSVDFVSVAYDSRYFAAGALLGVLAFASFFSCIEQMFGAAYLAAGRSDVVARCNAIKVVAFLVAIVPLGHAFGLIGAAWAIVAGEVAKAGMAIGHAVRRWQVSYGTILGHAVLAGSVGVSTDWLIDQAFASVAAPSFLMMLVKAGVVALGYGYFVYRTARSLVGTEA